MNIEVSVIHVYKYLLEETEKDQVTEVQRVLFVIVQAPQSKLSSKIMSKLVW
jgi:predicted DNA-binding transcriptional regulator